MSRPPFPISARSNQLRLVTSTHGTEDSQQPSIQASKKIIRGIAQPPSLIASLGDTAFVADYRLTTKEAIIKPGNNSSCGYVCETETSAEVDLALNQFQLLSTALDGPNIYRSGEGHWLMIQPQMKVRYKSSDYAARLGEIRLVESRRFLTLNNGETVTLLDTHELNEPVLYLQDQEDSATVRQQTPWQMVGESKEYCFDFRIIQPLTEKVNDQPVRNITVLEQYTSYFMERPLSEPLENSIWVPIYAAINWGWSMRVEPDSTGWMITRRKLMLPTVSHEEWQLPLWRSNTLEC